MKNNSEPELIGAQTKYLLRIKHLVKNKNVPIEDVGSCLDYNLHLNNRDETLQIDYLNEYGLRKFHQPFDTVCNKEFNLMSVLVEPHNYANTRRIMNKFSKFGDENSPFTYYQNIRDQINSDYYWRVTTRCVLNSQQFISITSPLTDLVGLSNQSEKLLRPIDGIENQLNKYKFLTKREKEIFKLIGEGYSSKEISDMKCISLHTVNVHRKNVNRKMRIKNRAELFRLAIFFSEMG